MTDRKPTNKYRCIRCGESIYKLGKTKMCQTCLARTRRREAESRVLQAIIDYKTENDGLPPTIPEVARLAYTNRRTAAGVIERLAQTGKIRLVRKHHYVGIMVTGGKWAYEEPR